MKSNLAKSLLKACTSRKENVFNNPLMNAAIFLDPRFRKSILNDETKVECAIQTLRNIWKRIKMLKDATGNTKCIKLKFQVRC